MTVIDKSGASDAEFRARIAPFEAAPTPPEVVVETVARALQAGGAVFVDARHPGDFGPIGTWSGPLLGSEARRLAAAAIAAMQPSPAEEAVKRVRRLCGAWDITGVPDRAVVVDRIRAALASPAPAPQDGAR